MMIQVYFVILLLNVPAGSKEIRNPAQEENVMLMELREMMEFALDLMTPNHLDMWIQVFYVILIWIVPAGSQKMETVLVSSVLETSIVREFVLALMIPFQIFMKIVPFAVLTQSTASAIPKSKINLAIPRNVRFKDEMDTVLVQMIQNLKTILIQVYFVILLLIVPAGSNLQPPVLAPDVR